MQTTPKVINVPLPMEDELFYSYVGRIADANGASANIFAQAFLYDQDKGENPKRIPYGAGGYFLRFFQCMGVNPVAFFLKTSIYPGYAPLLKRNEQNRMINIVFRGRKTFPALITNQHGEISELKYCPECIREDLHQKGFSWFRRAHQMPGVRACYKHGTLLKTAERKSVKYITTPINPPEAMDAAKIEIDYAAFAKDFLYAALNTDADILRKIVCTEFEEVHINKAVTKYGAVSINGFLGQESHKFFKSILINTGSVYIKPERLLKALFIIFSSVSQIPYCTDNELLKKFIRASKNYEVFKPFASTVVLMRKQFSDDYFVTTVDGFIAGWRDPKDDIGKTEEAKFEELLNNVKQGEYRLLTPFTGLINKVDLYHKRCKEVYTVRAKAIIEEGHECGCMQRILETDAKEFVEKDGLFKMLHFDDKTKKMKIYACECDHTFEVSLRAWRKSQECRCCLQGGKIRALGSRRQKKTKEEFEKQVRDLVGNEYRLISKYHGNNEPVTLLHTKCNSNFNCSPVAFLTGSRCRCQKMPAQKDFIDYVSIRSLGKYECRWNSSAKKYMIINTDTRETVGTWTKMFIIQELERPTLSPFLPMEEKGEWKPSNKKTINEIVRLYLECHFLQGDSYAVSDIKIDKLTRTQIDNANSRLMKKNIVKKVGYNNYIYLG